MNNQISILHLSDIHASQDTQENLSRLANLLFADLKKIKSDYSVPIDMICITGDMINAGDNAVEEWSVLESSLINPLLEELKIKKDLVFFVPGNHEVKRSQIIQYEENGLLSTFKDNLQADAFFKDAASVSHAIKRISYIDDFLSKYSGTPVLSTPLTNAYVIHVNCVKVGIVCVNSSWRSTGAGISEKQKLIVGKNQIVDGLDAVKDANIKICLMHHPLDWLSNDNKRTIEKCIGGFDIVLNGHIHELESKVYTTYNGRTLFNTCGKFDNSSDIFNGYAVVSLNVLNKSCKVILRQYLDYPRGEYDKAISLCEDGLFVSKLGSTDDSISLSYDMVSSISGNFDEYINGFFVSNVVTGKNTRNFDEAFIKPIMSEKSEYETQTDFEHFESRKTQKKDVDIEEVCKSKKCVVILGRKECGKTTLLHYLFKYYVSHFDSLHQVPIIVDCKSINFAGKNVVVRAISQFMAQFCDANSSFSLNDINFIVESGLFVIMFDNLDSIDQQRHLAKINEFIELHPKNRYIFTENEEVSARAMNSIPTEPNCDYDTLYIHSLTKSQIREVVQKNMIDVFEDDALILDKVMACFNDTALPKTPFVLTVILSLYENNGDFSPINEAVVMEQFMESILEKSSINEAKLRSYDFKTKEDFLIFLVSYMHTHNQYYLSYNEFEQLLSAYHSERGFLLSETGFSHVFFEKCVLVKTKSFITFRYSCMIEYYLAKRAGVEPDFLSFILKDMNYLNYAREMSFYTGLYRRDSRILSVLIENLRNERLNLDSPECNLENYEIDIDVFLPDDAELLYANRLSQQEADALSDMGDISEIHLPERIDKQSSNQTGSYIHMNNYIKTLLIMGNCLRNLELISMSEKELAMREYFSGLCLMLAIQKTQILASFNELIVKMGNDSSKYDSNEIQEVSTYAQDFIKVILPLTIQTISSENIGSAKLRKIIENILQAEIPGSFSHFFAVFLCSDLRFPETKNLIKNYIKKVTNKSMLKLAFFKVMFYWQIHYYPASYDIFLKNVLSELYYELQHNGKSHNFYKGTYKNKFIEELKKVERY